MRGLTARLALAMSAVAVTAALLAALVTVPLLRTATEDAVRDPLGRQAGLLARLPATALASERIEALTGRADLSMGLLDADGTVHGVAEALSAEDREALLDGEPVSTEGSYDGQQVVIEARPSRAGGAVVLASDAGAVEAAIDRLRRRVLFAIGLGLLAALGVAWLVAGRLGRPLSETAAAARRLAAGERGVPLPRSTTREVDDVTTALAGLDAALTDSEERQREFLLSVSHELRTPLTTVRGYAEGLADGVVRADEAADVGRTLMAEADRMERYVDDLLALARLEASDFSLDIAPVDLDELLEAAGATWRDRATRHDVTVQVVAEPAMFWTDGDRLRQVVDVLADNAVRVCQAGDRVVLAGSRTSDGVRLEVRDSGPGLTPEDAEVAFVPGALNERYAGTRPGGHGLGLAIAHRLVTRLGGTIRVDRAPEGGAAFVVDLPPSALGPSLRGTSGRRGD